LRLLIIFSALKAANAEAADHECTVRPLALYLYSVEIGLSTEARDGATGEELDAAVSSAMKAWGANAWLSVD